MHHNQPDPAVHGLIKHAGATSQGNDTVSIIRSAANDIKFEHSLPHLTYTCCTSFTDHHTLIRTIKAITQSYSCRVSFFVDSGAERKRIWAIFSQDGCEDKDGLTWQ